MSTDLHLTKEQHILDLDGVVAPEMSLRMGAYYSTYQSHGSLYVCIYVSHTKEAQGLHCTSVGCVPLGHYS